MNKPNNDAATDARPQHRKRFVMIDPLAIDKRLLYSVDGKPRIGLILEVERGVDGQFSVTQAMPRKLFKQGAKKRTVGNWHCLGKKWDSKNSNDKEVVDPVKPLACRLEACNSSGLTKKWGSQPR